MEFEFSGCLYLSFSKKYCVMRLLMNEIKHWSQNGKPFALATVVSTWRSAPRGVGSSMIIDEDMKMVGSVSGGCVEGQVAQAAKEVLKLGELRKLKFGVSNDDAWMVGLSCGGAIAVWVQPFFGAEKEHGQQVWEQLQYHLDRDLGCAVIYTEKGVGFFSARKKMGLFEGKIFRRAEACLKNGKSVLDEVGGKDVFYQIFPSKNKLVVIGAAHITRDLIVLAQRLDFSISVIDPRGLFYDSLKQLVDPEQLFRKWPAEILPNITLDQNVYAVLLTHDPKIDDQALEILLKADVAYIGALGSRKTHQRRVSRLIEAGFLESEIAKIHGPVGLDVGASTPAEIALSIMAEIVDVKNGRE